MFNNIGKKIKVLAKVICWIGIISGVIAGACFIIEGAAGSGSAFGIHSDTGIAFIAIGVAMLILLPLLSWIGSFTLYGFGELIDSTQQIKQSNEEILNRTSNIAQNVCYSAQQNGAPRQ